MNTLVSDPVSEGQVSEANRDNQVRRVGIMSAGFSLAAMLLFSVVSAATGVTGFIFIPLALLVVIGTTSVPLALQALRQVNRDPEDSGVVWAVVGLVVGVSLIVVAGAVFLLPSLVGIALGILLARKLVPFGDRPVPEV